MGLLIDFILFTTFFIKLLIQLKTKFSWFSFVLMLILVFRFYYKLEKGN